MSTLDIIGILVGWNLAGMFIVAIIMCLTSVFYGNVRGLEYNNPFVIYKLLRVNVFGAIMVALLFNIICPIASLCYWFYKLCTTGRKED